MIADFVYNKTDFKLLLQDSFALMTYYYIDNAQEGIPAGNPLAQSDVLYCRAEHSASCGNEQHRQENQNSACRQQEHD